MRYATGNMARDHTNAFEDSRDLFPRAGARDWWSAIPRFLKENPPTMLPLTIAVRRAYPRS